MLPWRSRGHRRPRPAASRDLPVRRGGRPLKRWRYVGVLRRGADGVRRRSRRSARVPQSWWAVWDRGDGSLRERTRLRPPARGVRFGAGRPRARCATAASASTSRSTRGPASRRWPARRRRGCVWTRKQAGIAARGSVPLDERACAVDGARRRRRHRRLPRRATPSGAGRRASGAPPTGRSLAWNLVSGVNDPPHGSERTVWVDGAPHEVGPVRLRRRPLGGRAPPTAADLASAPRPTRERHDELLLVRSDYRQPFGTFSGVLPGGAALAEGFGVMEDHRARW